MTTMPHMDAAVIGFMGALLGAVLGFIGSLLSTFGKSKDVELDVRTKVVTNERAQWRKDMRELAATYVALANQVANSSEPATAYDFERTRILIRLRLNPNPEHLLDADLLKLLLEVSSYAHDKSKVELKSKLEKFELNMQTLLKREWDKSKKEAESGNIATSDKHTA